MTLISKYIDQIKANFSEDNSDIVLQQEDLNYIKNESDPEENKQSTPPNDVKIYLPTIWVFEAYPPSFINKLIDGLLQLDLVEQIKRHHHRDVIERINVMRSIGYKSSWANLGIFAPKGSKIMPSSKVELPEGVNYVSSYLYQFVPSTTIMASQFYLTDDLITTLEEPLRKYYETYPEKIKGGVRYHSPIHQKEEAYSQQLEYLRTLCTKWIDDNFGGLFSSNLIDRHHPTVELILLENDEVMKDSYNPYESYLSIMGFQSEYEMYKSSELKEFLITLDESFTANRSSMTIAGNVNKVLSEEKLKGYSGENRINSIASWTSHLSKTLSFWSLTDIIFGYDQKLKTIRDILGNIDNNNPKIALPRLQKIEAETSTLQMNSVPFAYEIMERIDRKDIGYNMFEIESLEDRFGEGVTFNEARRDLLKNTAKSIVKNDEQLNRISNRLSHLITSQVNLELSESNNRLQLWILIFTVIVGIATISSFFDITLSTILNYFYE